MTVGGAPCNLLDVELALDRIEGQLAQEMPVHVRAFAAAYAAGVAPPAAPDLAGRASTVSVARRALPHPVLADRGLALLRLAAPLVIERDAGVAAARSAPPTWPAYAALVAARDTVAQARFGRPARAVLMDLHGAGEPDVAEMPAAIDGWRRDDGIELDIDAAWARLVARHRISGSLAILRADARPRAFVVTPGREAIIVVPRRASSPAARFAVLHELGHAVANLLSPQTLPRVLDEAIASLVARDDEAVAPIARAARARRTQLAAWLAMVERGDLAGDSVAPLPPWALWHDPAAQAAYVAAEAVADRLAPAADLRAALAAERTSLDGAAAVR